ncbi:hypothetical protein PMM47T1_16098 [Pseudomonas sp. M47T1]|nr:hypothetical protein PMM47T1_16098 [Pseudomonas sp. M47T1]
MAAGIPAGTLAKSTLWELGLLVATATLFSSLVPPLLTPHFPETLSVLILLVSGWIFAWVLKRLGSQQVVTAFIYQAVFLGVSAGIFTALISVISKNEIIPMTLWPSIGGAYIIAWLAGLVTPGAPAGVGIREMVLLLLLKGTVQEADLLMATLLGRLVTVTGDLLFFLCVSPLQPHATATDSTNA